MTPYSNDARLSFSTAALQQPPVLKKQDITACRAEATQMLREAFRLGMMVLDVPGCSAQEGQFLGDCLPASNSCRVILRTPRLRTSHLPLQRITTRHTAQLCDNFHDTLARLQCPTAYALLVDSVEDLFVEGGSHIFDTLSDLKNRWLVQKIGVQVNSPAELEKVLRAYAVDVVQVPLNILDQRWINSGALAELERRGIEVHANNPLLCGALVSSPQRLDSYFDPVRSLFEDFSSWCCRLGLAPLTVALAFCLRRKEIARVVVEPHSLEEVHQIHAAATSEVPKGLDFSRFVCNDSQFVEPGNWKIGMRRAA